jgi:hypothetical protein
MFFFISIFLYFSSFVGSYYYPTQYVPKVKYGGNAIHKIHTNESKVMRQYKYPPKAELTPEAKKKNDDMKNHRPRSVDWKTYNISSFCSICGTKHPQGKCVPPRNKIKNNH